VNFHAHPLTRAIAKWIDRPDVTDLCVDGPNGDLLVEINGEDGQMRRQSGELANLWAGHEAMLVQLTTWLGTMGRSWDQKHPFVDGAFDWGEAQVRFYVVLPPIAPAGAYLSLRKIGSTRTADAWTHSPAWPMLARAVRSKATLVIVGATGSGKTTLLQALLRSLPPSERIIALEDTPELRGCHPGLVTLGSRPPNADGFGEITLRTLLRQSLRMRPDRLLLGECRGPEVLDLLQSLNSGHRGSIATLHANTAREGIRRLELLALLSGAVPTDRSFVAELIAGGIQYFAHVRRSSTPACDTLRSTPQSREVTEVVAVEGCELGRVLTRVVFSAQARVDST